MSNQVEDNIVSMKFDNKQFESGVATSISSTEKLKQSLQFKNTGDGLNNISNNVRGFNLNPINDAIAGVNKGWAAMATIGITAISNITNKAVDAGLRMAKSLTLDPIAEGFNNYETKINAVQTILANTADQGTNLKDVTKNLNELNTYANKTVYNFSEMAKNIGTFTAAGVDLKTSTSSIKGIANLAALSGSTSQQASSAMYQLSQAIAAGQVHLQDWNSVVNAGIGGAAFQKNLLNAALATGTLDKSQVHFGKTMADTTVNGLAFRQSLTPPPGGTSWLTSGVLTKSLGTFTGDMTDAQLASQGFTKEQIKSIQAQAKMANNAATQIKTFSQLFQALKEEVGTAYATVFEALFGNINQAKKFLSPLHQVLENGLTQPIYAVADALKSWRKAGGFDDLVQIFKNLGTIVGNLLYPFKILFAGIVPDSKNAGKGLEGFTHLLAELTGWIAKATSVTHGVGSVFAGFADVVHMLVTTALKPLLDVGKQLEPVFGKLGDTINKQLSNITEIGNNLIAGWVQGIDPTALQKAATDLANSWIMWIKNALGIHSPATTMVPIGENIVQGIVQGLQRAAGGMITALQQIFIAMGKALKWAVENISYSDVLDTINSGLFLGIVLLFKRFVGTFGRLTDSFAGVMEGASGVLDQFKNNLKSMQNEVRSKVILNIAIAVGVLAASAVVLASVDSKKLAKALGAIGGLMISLVASLKLLTGTGKKGIPDAKTIAKQTSQLVALGAALIEFSTAILILSGAVAVMGQLDPTTMKQGLEGVAGVVALMVASTAVLGKTGGGGTILAAATAMIVLAAALTIFVGVMKLYEKLDMKTIISGGGKAALVIAAIGLSMQAFGKGAISGAAGMVVASVALKIMAGALTELSKIGLGDMIKTVVALDLIVGTLVFAADAMSAAEGGALSMLVMAGALFVLAKSLQILAKIPFLDLAKGLGAIVVGIVAIALTAAALSELSPLISALGLALLFVGGGLFLAGAGVFLFASALGILAVVGPAAFQALADGIDTMVEKLPEIGEAIGGFLVSILTGIALAAGPLAKALGKLIGILIDELDKLIPKAQNLIQHLINAIFEIIVHSYGHAAKVFLGLILSILKTLDNAVPKLINRGTALIVAIITGLGQAASRIVDAMGRTVLRFLTALDKAINKYEPQIIAKGGKIAADLVKGLIQGVKDGIPALNDVISSMAHSALDTLKHPSNWHILSPSHKTRVLGQFFAQGAADGIGEGTKHVEKAAEDMAQKSLNALKMTFASNKNTANKMIDLRPKITPVLDLTQLEKDAAGISAKMGSHSVKLDASRHKARDVAAGEAARHGSGDTQHGGNNYEFVQNIYSPKPVNHVKAYRGTKSQIALLKEVTDR